MIINIPDFSSKKENIDSFLGLCGIYEKYNYEFSKIKNIFGTKINLFEKKEIIKNIIKNKELNNKSINNPSHHKNNFKLFFPKIINKKNKYNKMNKTKSFDKKKFILKNFSKNSTMNLFSNIDKINNNKNSLNKRRNITIDNNMIIIN